jgi:hypothetical protein
MCMPHHQVAFQDARLPTSRKTVGTHAKEDIVVNVGRGGYRRARSHVLGEMGGGKGMIRTGGVSEQSTLAKG